MATLCPRSADYRLARQRLADTLSRNGACSGRILDAVYTVPRHIFVSEALRYRAYEDSSLPIGHGQTISKPSTVAKMLQALNLLGDERVLEIGSGTGYQSALLSLLAGAVVTMERIEELYKRARENLLIHLNLKNVTVLHGEDPVRVAGEFDAVVVAAGADSLPEELFGLLREGGVLMIPVADRGGQALRRYVKRPGGAIVEDHYGDARFVPLVRGG
ncbi:MAG TPA: protein-L-isoaspartate(D-aspartate) O-methyltransferase [Spirochaetes bacterium]|nr:protein-L-isoaspartate(D-aspartate) O-methyltransferase [Spirochaetota bacterium]